MDEFAQLPADPQFIGPMIDSLDAGFVVVDSAGQFQVWNAANTKILGKGARRGLPPDEWAGYYGLHCPIEQRLLRTEELPLVQAMRRLEHIDQEIVLINDALPQGRWIKVFARPLFSPEHELIGGAAIIRDVTHERASLLANQMMAWFFSASDDAIVGVNMQGTVLLWSPGAERLLGWSSEEMIGHSAFRLVPPGRHREIELLMQKAHSEQELPPLETRVLHKNGHEVAVSRSITAMRDANGDPIGGVVVARDISRLKRAELQLEESRQQLRLLSVRQQNLLEQQLRALARELHDEFGQQLAAMKFELAWLERHLDDNPRVEERLSSLNNLLDSTIAGLRRVSKQMRPPLLEEMGLCHALDELVSEIRARYPLQTSYECQLSNTNFNNEAALAIYRIVQEALTNVVRHAAARNVQVVLGHEGDRLITLITDDGRGLPADPKPAGGNFGILGMQERARSWAGEVKVYSPEQGGTQVRAEFPWIRVLAGP
ncbi:PAS domain S-box protein [bacterium]|nr:PAS domain S-box protein [bacterium]